LNFLHQCSRIEFAALSQMKAAGLSARIINVFGSRKEWICKANDALCDRDIHIGKRDRE